MRVIKEALQRLLESKTFLILLAVGVALVSPPAALLLAVTYFAAGNNGDDAKSQRRAEITVLAEHIVTGLHHADEQKLTVADYAHLRTDVLGLSSFDSGAGVTAMKDGEFNFLKEEIERLNRSHEAIRPHRASRKLVSSAFKAHDPMMLDGLAANRNIAVVVKGGTQRVRDVDNILHHLQLLPTQTVYVMVGDDVGGFADQTDRDFFEQMFAGNKRVRIVGRRDGFIDMETSVIGTLNVGAVAQALVDEGGLELLSDTVILIPSEARFDLTAIPEAFRDTIVLSIMRTMFEGSLLNGAHLQRLIEIAELASKNA